MNIPAIMPSGPPPRTNGTPSGYRNIRVLAPTPLHYQLVAYAGLSRCSLNEFVLKVLQGATPIDPITGLPVPTGSSAAPPGQRPGQAPTGEVGDDSSRGAAPAIRSQPSQRGDTADLGEESGA